MTCLGGKGTDLKVLRNGAEKFFGDDPLGFQVVSSLVRQQNDTIAVASAKTCQGGYQRLHGSLVIDAVRDQNQIGIFFQMLQILVLSPGQSARFDLSNFDLGLVQVNGLLEQR